MSKKELGALKWLSSIADMMPTHDVAAIKRHANAGTLKGIFGPR